MTERLLKPLRAWLASPLVFSVERFIAEGEEVIMQAHGQATARSGKPSNHTSCNVCRMVDGKLKEMSDSLDPELIPSALLTEGPPSMRLQRLSQRTKHDPSAEVISKQQVKEFPMSVTQSTARTRTITWEDPLPSAHKGRTMSGLDYLRALQSGELPAPPIVVLMGMSFDEIEAGRVVFAALPADYHYNAIGVVHGGLAATMLDSALGCAVHSTLPAGTGYTTLEIKVNYVRAITSETGKIRSEARVLSQGGRIATAEGSITDAEGKLYAHGTTTCLIFRP